MVIETPEGSQEEYEVLNVIEFTSTRKRMSVIVRDPRGRIRLLTKGGPSINDSQLNFQEFGNPLLPLSVPNSRNLPSFGQ